MASSINAPPTRRRFPNGGSRHTDTDALRHAHALAVCASTTVTNEAPLATASVIPPGNGSPGRHPAARNVAKNAPISNTASTGPRTPKARVATTRSSRRPRTGGPSSARRPAARRRAPSPDSMSVPMSRARICSTPSASGMRPPRQRPHDERRELGHVVGEVVGEEPADVRRTSRGPARRRRRCVAKSSSSSTRSAASRATSVPDRPIATPMSASLQRRAVVHAVAGHGHHVAAALQRPGDAQLVLGRDAATTTPSRSSSAPRSCSSSREVGPCQRRGRGRAQADLLAMAAAGGRDGRR